MAHNGGGRPRGQVHAGPGYETFPGWFAAFHAANSGRTVEDFHTGEQLTRQHRQFTLSGRPLDHNQAVAFCMARTGRLIAPTA